MLTVSNLGRKSKKPRRNALLAKRPWKRKKGKPSSVKKKQSESAYEDRMKNVFDAKL